MLGNILLARARGTLTPGRISVRGRVTCGAAGAALALLRP